MEKLFELLVSLSSKEIIQEMEPGASEWCMQKEWEAMDLKLNRTALTRYKEKD